MGILMSIFSVLSSSVIVLDNEDGETSSSFIACCLINLPIVDCSSVSVIRATSTVSAIYGSSQLLLFPFLILLIWLSSDLALMLIL